METWWIVAGAYAVMSVLSFLAYGWDKWSAKRGTWRTPEKTLHTLDLLGGWPGGYVASQLFRHKTQKMSYRVVFWLIVALHVGIWGWVGYRALTAQG